MTGPDFTFGIAWEHLNGDQVNFQFSADQCTNFWGTYAGNRVPLAFKKTRTEYEGKNVPIAFKCEGVAQSQYTFFDGFIEATSGAEAFTNLENHIQISGVDFYSGEAWLTGTCSYSSTIENVGGSQNSGAITSNSIRLQNSGGSTVGSTVAMQAVDTTSVDEVEFFWEQSLSGSWYDNDNTDATHRFGLFFDREHTAITTLGGTWEYDTPFDGYSVGNNRPWLDFWLPRDLAAKTITPGGRDAAGTWIPLPSFTKPADLDLYANAAIKVKIVNDGGKVRSKFYVNGDLLSDELSQHDWPSKVVAGWHYHNYSSASSYIDITNIGVCSGIHILTTYPSPNFNVAADFFAGAELEATLSVTYSLSTDFTDGENLDLALTTVSPIHLGVSYPDGAEAGVSLVTTSVLEPSFYDGANADIDLTVSLPALLGLSVFDGAETSASLSTSVILGPELFSGEDVSAVLETFAPASFVIAAYAGAEVSPIGLTTSVALRPSVYDGAEATFDFTPFPAIGITLNAYDGASAEIEYFSTAVQLGNLSGYEGASVSVTIESLDNYYIYDGASAEVELATEATIVANAYAGESVSADLTSKPSEGIGTFRFYEGASVSLSVKPLQAILLYPNEIKDPGAFNWDVLGFISVDLNNTSCCPVLESFDKIELTGGPAADEHYRGEKVLFTADLSTRPRFKMDFYEGLNFRAIDPEFMTFNFYDGSGVALPEMQSEFFNFNLCPGNFIPDGNNINVELISTDLSNCESTLIFDGASSNLDIEANPQFAVPLYDGGHMDFNFVVVTAWILNFYSGEYVRISNPEFTPRFYADAMVSFKFEEKDIYAFAGEAMTLSGLSTDYSVEFLERGCLDNEFIPMDENGDADMDKFNPVPVELEFFSHSIKARCF